MDFMEAVKAMKEGKKINRPLWNGHTTYLEDMPCFGIRIKTEFSDAGISLEDIESTDWEIYKEEDNWNLADEISPHDSMKTTEAIKTFIQKVKGDVDKLHPNKASLSVVLDMVKIIDKRAGDLK